MSKKWPFNSSNSAWETTEGSKVLIKHPFEQEIKRESLTFKPAKKVFRGSTIIIQIQTQGANNNNSTVQTKQRELVNCL